MRSPATPANPYANPQTYLDEQARDLVDHLEDALENARIGAFHRAYMMSGRAFVNAEYLDKNHPRYK